MPTDVAENPGKALVEALLKFRESRIAYCEKHPTDLVGAIYRCEREAAIRAVCIRYDDIEIPPPPPALHEHLTSLLSAGDICVRGPLPAGGADRLVAVATGIAIALGRGWEPKPLATAIGLGSDFTVTDRPTRVVLTAGRSYARLTAAAPMSIRHGQDPLWLFRCQCGNLIVESAISVRRGLVTNCGCRKSHRPVGRPR